MQEDSQSFKAEDSAIIRLLPTKQMTGEIFKEHPALDRSAIRDMKQNFGFCIIKKIAKKFNNINFYLNYLVKKNKSN